MAYYVKVYCGPTNSFHTRSLKPQKLSGFKDRLIELGYRIDFVPVEYINYCTIEMCGHEIFRCNLQNLMFNTPWHFDPVCQRAVLAVTNYTARFIRATLYGWLAYYLDREIFDRHQYSAKNYWPFDVDLQSYANPTDCGECCKILFTKKKPEDF